VTILTAQDATALRTMFTDAQWDHSLVLRRPADAGGDVTSGETKITLPAQLVQVSYAQRQPDIGGLPGTAQSLTGVTFYRESPFDVQTGDRFVLDGHTGGTIRRAYPDPVLGVIVADGDIDMGR